MEKKEARIRNENRPKKLGFVMKKGGDKARIRNENRLKKLVEGGSHLASFLLL